MPVEKKKPDDVLEEVITMLANNAMLTVSDAIRVGMKIKEYGDSRAAQVIDPLFDGILKNLDKRIKDEEDKKPW